MPSVAIRQATPDDIDAVAELFDLYRQFYKKAPDQSAARTYIQDRLSGKDSVIFVAETSDKKMVGFVQLYPSFSSLGMSRTWIFNDLYVLEEYRRNNVASELIKAIHAYAESTGATSINLETQHDNRKAQALYEKFGYEVEKDFLVYSFSLKDRPGG